MENGKRRSTDEGILIEMPTKRFRNSLVEFDGNDKDGQLMEIEVN